MPFAREFFNEFSGVDNHIESFNGRTLTPQQLIDTDVLLVRSITKVNESLLSKASKLKFVGTATIGVDHIDQDYLKERKIAFHSAPGCNAVSVAEYVLSSLVVLSERYLFSIKEKTVGIVGAGNTGSRLSEKLTALGIKHKLCDPILAEQGDKRKFYSLDEVLSCDIISLHVPLTKQGQHATYHLLNEERLNQLSEQQILINACRGEVVDNHALLAMKKAGSKLTLVLDVWENEPNVLTELIPYCDITSAHIAGYSLEGKARGTEMLYRALCTAQNLAVEKQLAQFLPLPTITDIKINQNLDEIVLNQVIKMVYDVRRDDALFRQQLPRFGFDHIRKTYPARREFSSLAISGENIELDALFQLGFKKTVQIEEEK